MLASPECCDLILETYNTLNGAVSSAISTETPPELTAALRNNAFIFSGFKSYHTLSEVGLSLTRPDGSAKPFNEFSRDVRAIDNKYNTNYLYAEYNHAVRASQMAVKWHDYAKEGDRYLLQYRTAGDERVREAHAALNGTTLPPSDEFWRSYMPPNGWNCRCNVVQVLADDYRQSDSAAAIAAGDACTAEPKQQIFRFNPGTELKVFPEKHPYLPKGCGACPRKGAMNLARGLGLPQCRACTAVMRECLREVDTRIKEWYKANIPEHGHKAIEEENILTGKLLFNRRSIKQTMEHTANMHILNMLPGIDNADLKYKYVGWAPLKPDAKTGKIKHENEATCFLYYEIEIAGHKYYANVMVHKHYQAEVLYCIYEKCDLSALEHSRPPGIDDWIK